jgi:hypothetical protein
MSVVVDVLMAMGMVVHVLVGMSVGGAVGVGVLVAVLMGVYVAVGRVVGVFVVRPVHVGVPGIMAMVVMPVVAVGNAVLVHIFVIVLVIHVQSPFHVHVVLSLNRLYNKPGHLSKAISAA